MILSTNNPFTVKEYLTETFPGVTDSQIKFLENWREATIKKLAFLGWNNIIDLKEKATLMNMSTLYCEYLFDWVEFQEQDMEAIGGAASDN